MSSRILMRPIKPVLARSSNVVRLNNPARLSTTVAAAAPTTTTTNKGVWERPVAWILAGAFVTAASIGSVNQQSFPSGGTASTTSLDALGTLPLPPIQVGPVSVSSKNPHVESSAAQVKKEETAVQQREEPETGISFPPSFQAKELLGLGVRKKYQFFNVYAVGFYVNKEDFRGLDEQDYEEALLNPHNHRTARIVMNRTLTMDKVVSTLIESLEPRMHGRDLFALDHFSKMRKYGSLNRGDEIIINIRGNSVECKCSNGGQNVVVSEVFTRAICDVYFGKQPISPAAKESAIKGISDL
ncbi:expressed unknown protein [Seminavis robusta]|uniref:Chalcone isomerase domain-containing protein n=1 Tax=Seminavis robusta TaxID=568900 RepID=A0A9N8DR29_9STRA|nr:expressed unknown protein [Seminavis robusta]|eukprot:Sro289_g109170.1 n/a (299) ;mRNA; r:62258-63285